MTAKLYLALATAAVLAIGADAKIWASIANDPACKPIPDDPGTGISNWKQAIVKYGSTPMWNIKDVNNTGEVPGGNKVLMKFTSWWGLKTRPRRPILIIEDMNMGYAPFLGYLVPKVQQMIAAFRKAGLPILWTTWARRWNDGAYGSNDRFYGPSSVKQDGNPEYVFHPDGISIMKEVAPKSKAEWKFVLESMHLSKFNDRYADGTHILGPLLSQMSIDTVVMTGGWTEDCILGTISDAVDAWGLDAIAVSDAVGTATPEHKKAESIYKTSYAALYSADELTKFMGSDDGAKYFLKPMVAPEDTIIKPTTEPIWQKDYVRSPEAFAKTPVQKVTGPITLKPGAGGPTPKPLSMAQVDLSDNLDRLQAENAKLREENARLKQALAQAAPAEEEELAQDEVEEMDDVVPEDQE